MTDSSIGTVGLLLRLKQELNVERKRREAAEEEMRKYRVEYKNYFMSWSMEKAEARDLREQLKCLQGVLSQHEQDLEKVAQEERERRLVAEKLAEEEKEKRLEMEKIADEYRIEYKNYLLSWTMEKAETGRLEERVQQLKNDMEQVEMEWRKKGDVGQGDGDSVHARGVSNETRGVDADTQTEFRSRAAEPSVASTDSSEIPSRHVHIPSPPASIHSSLPSCARGLRLEHIPLPPCQKPKTWPSLHHSVRPYTGKARRTADIMRVDQRSAVPWK